MKMLIVRWVLSGAFAAIAILAGVAVFWTHEERENPRVAGLVVEPSNQEPPSVAAAPKHGFDEGTTPSAHAFKPDADEPPSSELLTGPVKRLKAAQEDARPLYPATERVYLAPGEAVRVPLNRKMLAAGSPVVLRADHGGVLEGRALSPQVELPAGADSFTFHAGGHRGRYTVSVSQAARSETLEFWVGEEPPRGLPGPPRTFTAPADHNIDS